MLLAPRPQPQDPGYPSSYYIEQAKSGLNSWQISLDTTLRASTRTMTGGGAYSPMNWVTASGDDCIAAGVPSDMFGIGCVFGGSNVIGICQIRTYANSGQIADTTLLVRRGYLDSKIAPEGWKRAVFSHEVGHCLGLMHSSDISHIMYPSITDTPGPAIVELAAILEAYPSLGAVAEPSTATRDNFYFTKVRADTSVTTIRQYAYPLFHLDSNMGHSSPFAARSMALESRMSGAPPLDTITIYFHDDGREEILRTGP